MLIIAADSNSLHVVDGSPLPSGSINKPSVMFELDSFWEQYAVTAVFDGNGKTVQLANIASGVQYSVPWECVTEPGVVKISLFGIKEGVLSTVIGTSFQVVESGINEAALPQSPTPSAYEQYVNTVSRLASDAENSAALAQQTVENIKDYNLLMDEAKYVLKASREAYTSAESVLDNTEKIMTIINSVQTKPTAVINQNNGNFIYFWIGTRAEYGIQVANGKSFDDCYCIFTDDTTMYDAADLLRRIAAYIMASHSTPAELNDALAFNGNNQSDEVNLYKYRITSDSANRPNIDGFNAVRDPIMWFDDNAAAIVTLTEVRPVYGRRWINIYSNDHSTPADNSWQGWKIMSTPTDY